MLELSILKIFFCVFVINIFSKQVFVLNAQEVSIFGPQRKHTDQVTKLSPVPKAKKEYNINYDIYPIYSDRLNHPSNSLLPDAECGESLEDRIIGGTNAAMGQFPWLVRIGYSIHNCNAPPKYQCAGVIIAEKYILTAAHCVANLQADVCPTTLQSGKQLIDSVRVGEFNATTDPDCEMDVCAAPVQDIKVEHIFIHEEYDNPRFKNDIALIKLRHPITFDEYVSPICLPYGNQVNHNYVGSEGTVAGWGLKNTDLMESSDDLLYIPMPILALEECVDFYSVRGVNVTPDKQFCAGGELGQDSCSGDSGGPLMLMDGLNGQPKSFAMGIVSFGPKKCGSTVTPAVYTKIVAYTTWILDKMSL